MTTWPNSLIEQFLRCSPLKDLSPSSTMELGFSSFNWGWTTKPDSTFAGKFLEVEGLSWTLLSILFIFWVKLEPTKLSLSMEVKISPPISIKAVMITSWVLENSSISTVDMLETVDADTAVKNRSRSASLMVVAFSTESFKARKPKTERMM